MSAIFESLAITLLYFVIVTSSFFSNSSILNGEGCDALTIKSINVIINEVKPLYVKNPFNQKRCIPISFKDNDILTLNRSHFENSQVLFNIYQDFVQSSETQVTQVRTANHNIINFLKINLNSAESQRFMINVNKTKLLKKRYKHWTFFHELMHLSQRTESKNIYLNRKTNEQILHILSSHSSLFTIPLCFLE